MGVVPIFVVIERSLILTLSNQTSVVLLVPLITQCNSRACQPLPLVTDVVLVKVTRPTSLRNESLPVVETNK